MKQIGIIIRFILAFGLLTLATNVMADESCQVVDKEGYWTYKTETTYANPICPSGYHLQNSGNWNQRCHRNFNWMHPEHKAPTGCPEGFSQEESDCVKKEEVKDQWIEPTYKDVPCEGTCPTKCGMEASEVPDGQGGTKVCEATPACEKEGICPTECGYAGGEVADGQGGTKVCEATPKCEEPQPEPEKEVKHDKRPDLDFTQGPGGRIGDGWVRLKWKLFKDCSKVKIKISNTHTFGKDHETLKLKDDGSEWIKRLNTFWAKIRCYKDGSKYSEVEKITP